MNTPRLFLTSTLLATGIVAAQPANDSCNTVLPVALGMGSTEVFTGDNTGATTDADGVFMAYPTVWHAFTIIECAHLMVNYCTTTPAFDNIWLELAVDCPPSGTITAFTYNVLDCSDGNYSLYYTMVPAGTYWLGVLADVGATGPYTVSVAAISCALPPANDECPDAAVLTVFPLDDCPANATVGDNTLANGGGIDPGCAIGSNNLDLWYTFNSGSLSEVSINLAPGTMTDWNMAIYQACGGVEDTCVVHPLDPVIVPVTPGTDYLVRVFSSNDPGSSGDFDICVSADFSTAVGSLELDQWQVFPNPTTEVLWITCHACLGVQHVELVDLAGRVVFHDLLVSTKREPMIMSLPERVFPGTYVLRLSSATTGQRLVRVD